MNLNEVSFIYFIQNICICKFEKWFINLFLFYKYNLFHKYFFFFKFIYKYISFFSIEQVINLKGICLHLYLF